MKIKKNWTKIKDPLSGSLSLKSDLIFETWGDFKDTDAQGWTQRNWFIGQQGALYLVGTELPQVILMCIHLDCPHLDTQASVWYTACQQVITNSEDWLYSLSSFGLYTNYSFP